MTKNDNKKLKEIIDLACEEAKRLGNTKVSPEHFWGCCGWIRPGLSMF